MTLEEAITRGFEGLPANTSIDQHGTIIVQIGASNDK